MISSRGELEQATGEMKDLATKKAAVLARQEGELTAVRDKYAAELLVDVDGEVMHVDARYAQLHGEVEVYCNRNRSELTPGKKKSAELTHGTISWVNGRTSIEELKLSKAKAAATLVATCMGLIKTAITVITHTVGKLPALNLLRITVEWDKPAIKKAYDEGQITAKELKAEGLQYVVGDEKFSFKPKIEKPSATAPSTA